MGYFYRPGNAALKDISLMLKVGTPTAIIGPSGSGKSTLLKLLMGLYLPTEGSIKVNGVDLTEIDAASYRRCIGTLLQNSHIFSGSVMDNVIEGSSRVDRKKYLQSLLGSGLYRVVQGLPAGDDTLIGSGGTPLSAGERQRVLIARAMYKDPGIFLMDEGTNNLDAITERNVQQNLLKLARHSIVVIVTHRIRTTRHIENIVFLTGGKILAIGTHSELYANCVAYREMYDAQS